MAILSNTAPGRLIHATVTLPFVSLDNYKKGVDGKSLAHRIENASDFALAVPERASTHNKGILNGVCAVATAFGQDTRAISVSAIDYACRSGEHQPLATWKIADGALLGSLRMPMVLGFVGGSKFGSPQITAAYEIADVRDYDDLCAIHAAIALAQNFAALAALTTEGIQAAHLKLHNRKKLCSMA